MERMLEDTDPVVVRNLRYHLTLIKLIGVILIVLTCAASPILIIGLAASNNPMPLDYEVRVESQAIMNQTACVYVKQFSLQENLYATICNVDGTILVDLRHFLNGSATILGIPLHLKQWLSLKQMSSSIDTAIDEARTYWKSLRNL